MGRERYSNFGPIEFSSQTLPLTGDIEFDMQKPESTQFGGIVVNGIEYNEDPPPERLVKAMDRKWAVELVERGAIRLHNLEYYQQWENEVLGDRNEGKGL